MGEYYDSLKRGLEEALEYTKGNVKLRSFRVKFEPVPEYAPEDIKRIRTDSRMTQAAFAGYLGVTTKAVEAWERGRNKPTGPARRLMSMAAENPEVPTKYYSVTESYGFRGE
ncbi:MAG: helix-turn-helix domain-containing protein [Oscillospiraceae bacterium]|nr:helix-turn-helix domain-containing protein [Oscillospiraceae bacterium]